MKIIQINSVQNKIGEVEVYGLDEDGNLYLKIQKTYTDASPEELAKAIQERLTKKSAAEKKWSWKKILASNDVE